MNLTIYKYLRFILAAAVSVALSLPAFAQRSGSRQTAAADADAGQVLMLEEIRIQVGPELPTVVISIPRQQPDLKSVSLAKDARDMITAGAAQVKPRIADLQVSRIEEPQKMLAKERSQ